MLRHQFGQHLILRLDLPFQMGDSFLFGLMVGPVSLLESRRSVLEAKQKRAQIESRAKLAT